MKHASYNKYPEVQIAGFENQAWQGWKDIVQAVQRRLHRQGKTVLVIDCYPGVRHKELHEKLISQLSPSLLIYVENARLSEQHLHNLLAQNLTDDRVFGVLSCHQLDEFFCPGKLAQARREVDNVTEGLVVIYGPGAALVHQGDILIYADLARWEIQQRFRTGELGNWGAGNESEDILRRYKLFSLSGACLTAIKRRCLNVPISCLIPIRRTPRQWSAGKRCATLCKKLRSSRSAWCRSSTRASGADNG